MKRIALVGCSAQKLDRAAPARELYTSPLFRLARRYAELTCDAWMVLSAKHRGVHPDQVLEPYDKSFGGDRLKGQRAMDVEDRQCWALCAHNDVHGFVCRVVDSHEHARLQEVTVVLLAGEDYEGAAFGLSRWSRRHLGTPPWKVEKPLEGMGIGQRLGWLKREVEAAEQDQAPVVPVRTDEMLQVGMNLREK